MPQTVKPIFERIDTWLHAIETTKSASAKPAKKTTKKAGPSGLGETSHPSENVDNNTQSSDTGARAAENEKDVEKDIPASVNDAPENKGAPDDNQFNIGMNQSSVGEDPSVEDDYKGDKDDPGTTHPADAEDTGEKYSSMNVKQLIKLAEARGNALLADIAADIKKPAQAPTKAAAPVQAAQKVATPAAPAQPFNLDLNFDKIANDVITQAIVDAEQDADLVGGWLHARIQAKKQAEEGAADMPAKEDESAPPPETGGMPPAGGAGGGDVLSALGAGGADAGAGGPPPDAGAGAGGGGQEQAIQELAMALQELGISPEELMQALQGGGDAGGAGAMGGAAGGMGGAMPPPPPGGDMGGAGAPPMPPPGAMDQGAKIASAVKAYKRSGKFRFEEAKSAQQRAMRDQMKDYIRELTGNRI